MFASNNLYMGIYTENLGTKLNTLLVKTFDAEKGFLKAAGNSKHPNLKTFFTKQSKERYDFGYELKEELRKLGQSIEKGGSAAATVHRAWMDIRSTISKDNDKAMLTEALKVEEAALHEYEEVLEDKSLPPTTSIILKKQKNIILANLETVKILADVD